MKLNLVSYSPVLDPRALKYMKHQHTRDDNTVRVSSCQLDHHQWMESPYHPSLCPINTLLPQLYDDQRSKSFSCQEMIILIVASGPALNRGNSLYNDRAANLFRSCGSMVMILQGNCTRKEVWSRGRSRRTICEVLLRDRGIAWSQARAQRQHQGKRGQHLVSKWSYPFSVLGRFQCMYVLYFQWK